MFSSLSYFWGETFRSLFRNRFMAIASVLTVTLSMFILGVFLSAVLNINHMASYLENQVEMTVYLKDGLTTDQVMGIGKYLKAQPGMKEIKFTNKDQAMKDFRERMGDQQGLLDAINGNPLPASYQMSFQTPEQLKTAAEVVAKYQAYELSSSGKDIIEQLYKLHRSSVSRESYSSSSWLVPSSLSFLIPSALRFCQKKRDPDHEVRRCLPSGSFAGLSFSKAWSSVF